jgi:hypothetical protein
LALLGIQGLAEVRMDVQVAQELLNELGSSLENLEAQQAALMQFLKDKGIVTDEELDPYLNEAGNASSVRWRAARVRLEHIFSTAAQKEQQTAKPEDRQTTGIQTPPNKPKDSKEPEKPAESGIKATGSERARMKEEKTEHAGTAPQAAGGGAKARETEHESSTQRREEDAA